MAFLKSIVYTDVAKTLGVESPPKHKTGVICYNYENNMMENTTMTKMWIPAAMMLAGFNGASAVAGAKDSAPKRIPLWPGKPPTGGGKVAAEKAFITVHRPATPNGAAVVICPGGGYGMLVTEGEGHGIARWLNQHGIAGIVLEYRLPKGNQNVPLLDAQRAIRMVRSNAREWGIEPHRIGIIGFSAGGHLASTAATHFDKGNGKAKDPIESVGCRPDFAILIYPVVTMGPLTHGGSRNNLLGPDPKPVSVELFSNEKQVTAQTPPTFLAHAQDDTCVVPENSQVFYDALQSNGVAATYLKLPSGGHGLNGYKGPMWDAWQTQSLQWLTAQGMIPSGSETVVEKNPLSSFVVQPTRIVWSSDQGVENAANLLKNRRGQAVLNEPVAPLIIKPGGAIVLDFGKELAGSVELFTTMCQEKGASVRVRFGESVAEAMAEQGERGAQNDHALRDQVVSLPWLGKITIGPSGFRFVRIDNADAKKEVHLSQVSAILTVRDVPQVGSFRCSDERLNRIWEVGAYTVHLNMQEYLWDGIKRDRLVWLGDMHPEVSVVNCVFGFNDVVPKSLDMIRNVTPVTSWMNGISSYSMWWILIQDEWYLHHGNLDYLKQQQSYLTALLRRLTTFVADDGRETLDGMRFLDWPTYSDKVAVHEGLQAMLTLTMESGARLCETLGDKETAKLCADTAKRLRTHMPESSGRKAPAALLSIAGLRDAAATSSNVLKKEGTKDLSTFYGFYVLNALAKSGDIDTGLDFISEYWGGMMDFGATTFWEDFDLAWTTNAGRIDELVAPGKKDLHGDFGAYCYTGFRHSFCHGWAGGPTAWLSKNILGITPVAPGCAKVRIAPQLGRLAWAEGTYPTPKGPIHVRHDKQRDGSIKTTVKLPKGIVQVKD